LGRTCQQGGIRSFGQKGGGGVQHRAPLVWAARQWIADGRFLFNIAKPVPLCGVRQLPNDLLELSQVAADLDNLFNLLDGGCKAVVDSPVIK
jgi:hypothetical protein